MVRICYFARNFVLSIGLQSFWIKNTISTGLFRTRSKSFLIWAPKFFHLQWLFLLFIFVCHRRLVFDFCVLFKNVDFSQSKITILNPFWLKSLDPTRPSICSATGRSNLPSSRWIHSLAGFKLDGNPRLFSYYFVLFFGWRDLLPYFALQNFEDFTRKYLHVYQKHLQVEFTGKFLW